jgi:prevent-host-death family protein
MDLQELKRILQKDKGKIIIVENGKPLMVVIPYEDFAGQNNQEEIAEVLGNEEEIGPTGPGELTIDDLPL